MILVASDFHLGNEEANYEKINDFLTLAYEADQLILLGDTFECWLSTLSQIKSLEPMKTSYNLLCEVSQSVPTLILTGNHDYNIAGKVPFIITSHYTQNNIYYTHGWEFDLMQWAGYPYFGTIIKFFPYIYQRYIYHPSYLGLPYKVKDVHQFATNYTITHNYDYLIMGHTHHSFTNNIVFDCGSFLNPCTYIQIDEKPKIRKL